MQSVDQQSTYIAKVKAVEIQKGGKGKERKAKPASLTQKITHGDGVLALRSTLLYSAPYCSKYSVRNNERISIIDIYM